MNITFGAYNIQAFNIVRLLSPKLQKFCDVTLSDQTGSSNLGSMTICNGGTSLSHHRPVGPTADREERRSADQPLSGPADAAVVRATLEYCT